MEVSRFTPDSHSGIVPGRTQEPYVIQEIEPSFMLYFTSPPQFLVLLTLEKRCGLLFNKFGNKNFTSSLTSFSLKKPSNIFSFESTSPLLPNKSFSSNLSCIAKIFIWTSSFLMNAYIAMNFPFRTAFAICPICFDISYFYSQLSPGLYQFLFDCHWTIGCSVISCLGYTFLSNSPTFCLWLTLTFKSLCSEEILF